MDLYLNICIYIYIYTHVYYWGGSNNNDVIVPEDHDNSISSKTLGITGSGTWNMFYSADTGKQN